MNYKLIAYALDFSSFLVQRFSDQDKIKRIILFGSVARGEAAAESDIDIFVDVIKEDDKISRELQVIAEEFRTSVKCRRYWIPLGISNEIKPIAGRLSSWKELHSSLQANGLTLYDKFKMEAKEGKHQVLFAWENVHPNSRRVLFNKQMFGFKQKGRFYNGLLQKYSGERMSKGSILVPAEHKIIFHQQFKRYKIAVKIKQMVEV
jgi:hypothetical protein